MMDKNGKIYVAGHRGMVGSAIYRELKKQGYDNIITRTHKELDLQRQNQVEAFFAEEKPDYVFHWRGGYLTRETLIDLCTRIDRAAANRDKGVLISVNWPQAVLYVQFTDQVPMQIRSDDAGEDVQ
mgnify:CR=1 FL=1